MISPEKDMKHINHWKGGRNLNTKVRLLYIYVHFILRNCRDISEHVK